MIDILIEKLETSISKDIWSYNDSSDSNILVSPFKDIVIEWTDTGYFQIQKEKIMFNDCVNGHTYSFRKNGSREDWKKFQDLFIEASETKLFRIDAPIFREEKDKDGSTWEYTKVARPGGGVGQVSDQHFINREMIGQFLEGIIDPYYHAIDTAIKIAKNNPGPVNPDTGLSPPLTIPDISIRHALKDDQGYYFAKNFDVWDQIPEKVIRMCIGTGMMLIRDIDHKLPADFIEKWTVRAFDKWTSVL
jgi:hypothetical protein